MTLIQRFAELQIRQQAVEAEHLAQTAALIEHLQSGMEELAVRAETLATMQANGRQLARLIEQLREQGEPEDSADWWKTGGTD